MEDIVFIGAGPGDPEDLTLRGARALAKARAVFAPEEYRQSFSVHLEGKAFFVPFHFDFLELVEKVETLLQSGPVAFLVPGDLTFFSPFQALVDHFGKRCAVLPGVGVVNAASACLKKTLNLPEVCSRTSLVSTRALEERGLQVRDVAAPKTTLVIYMNHLPLEELVTQLRQGIGEAVPVAIVHRLGLSGEEVLLGDLDDIGEKAKAALPEKARLSLILVGEALTATKDPSWWDETRRTRWCPSEK